MENRGKPDRVINLRTPLEPIPPWPPPGPWQAAGVSLGLHPNSRLLYPPDGESPGCTGSPDENNPTGAVEGDSMHRFVSKAGPEHRIRDATSGTGGTELTMGGRR